MPMRKDRTWIGGFGPELMLCAASVRVGPARGGRSGTAGWGVMERHRVRR